MSADERLCVAVTGAGGYLGRPLVRALERDERVSRILAIDLSPPPASAGVVPIVRDIRDPAIEAELAGVDAVVHLAAVVLGRGNGAVGVNVDGSRNLFEAAARAGVRTIVHASSAAAYGCAPDNPVGLGEDDPLRPVPGFYYPQTKVRVEQFLDEFERRHPSLRVVRMRPVSVIGPDAPIGLGGRVFVSLSNFDPLMQFVWVDDAVDAFTRVLHADVSGPFNVGAPNPVRSSEVARLLGVRAVRLPHRLLRGLARFALALRLPGALDPAWVDMARYPIVVDAGRIEREVGWRPRLDCAGTLRRYAAARQRSSTTSPPREGTIVTPSISSDSGS